MAEHTEPTISPGEKPTFSVVTVPEHLRKQVQGYVNQLVESEADTSAYMLGLGGADFQATNCHWVDTGSVVKDLSCSDHY